MKRVSANVLGRTYYPHIQNGVDNVFFYCLNSATGAGDTYANENTKLNSEDEIDMDEDDGCSRSSADPGKNAVKPFVFDTRFSSSTNADGSLPSSPDTPSACGKMPEFPASPNGKFEKETLEIIEMFYRTHTGDSRSAKTNTKVLSTMKRVVDHLIEKHQFAYNGMILKLSLDQQEDSMKFISCIAKNIFSDGTTNWGRIASLLAFGAVVCEHLKDSGREHCVPVVSQEISSFLLSEQRDWLLNNKAWEGFVEFFHVEDPESVVRSALMAFAGVAGIGAGLAYLIR
ncbi:induced myeloid leukemia cell differentiation protein Mcl-1b [Anguilla anguilla]|uniref:induced myeloid leukemia cell differentiation protein Mcl-1b n=1 Tax=Anguilla anguilla TaxID=7936 RepID=UPI0015A9D632|nr:induced myeloid leukemia cell differentiation protein Mcl-1b [Anguilla anguilla]